MSRKKLKITVNPEHASSCYAILDTLRLIAEDNQVKFWRQMQGDRSPGVTGSYKYWKNVASGLRWAQGLVVEVCPDAAIKSDGDAGAG